MSPVKTKRLYVGALILALTLILKDTPAFATDEIYSPNVEYREFSLEYTGSRTFDPHADKNNAQTHELILEAGLTPRWAVEASGGFIKDSNNSLKMEGAQIESRFQFFESGENWEI